jgi:hypothetical protein
MNRNPGTETANNEKEGLRGPVNATRDTSGSLCWKAF